MATVSLSAPPILQFFNNLGQPNAGGSLLTQVGNVNYVTYQDSAGTIPLPNPIPLNARGEISNSAGTSCQLFLVAGVTYTFTLYDALSNQINQATSTYGDSPSLSSSSGSSLVGFIQSSTGAVATNVSAYLNLNVKGLKKSFGAVGDGVADDTTAITNALASGKIIEGEEGTYITGSHTLPVSLELRGWGSTATIFKAKAATNNPVFILANSNNKLVDFGIAGNSANQSVGPGNSDGIRATGGSRYTLENIIVDDVVDWGFRFESCSNVRLLTCDGTNLVGGTSSVAIRAAFIFGTNGLPCTNAVAIACNAIGGGTYTDGFLSEAGSNHRIIGCNAAVPYSGFKFNNSTQVIATDNYAAGCLTGFQTLGVMQGLTLSKNIAYRNNGAGFQFNQSNSVTPALNWVISGNQAIENGQNAGSAIRYGFAFEPAAACTIDHVVFTGNIAVDNQGSPTQTRGISFTTTGTVTNATISGNSSKGHTNDFVGGTTLDLPTAVIGPNNFTTGSPAIDFVPAKASHQLRFWANTVAAGAGVTALSDGLSGRGYVMARAGYVRSQSALSTAAVTAGSINFQPRKNGSNFTSNVNCSTGTFTSASEIPKAMTFVAGDIITCIFTSTAGLLPAGTNNFDVVVEVVYT